MRRQAKWIFAILAVVFAGSFVAFGVGSEVPGGIADILQGRAPTTGPSVEEAQEKVDANPRDPEALRELATALQAEGRPDDAIPILERYSRLRPQDEDALRELASLHIARAGRIRNEVQAAQIRAAQLTPGAEFALPPTTPLGQALADRPIQEAVNQTAQSGLAEELRQLEAAYRAAKELYQRLVVLDPDNPTLQLQLADASLNANDTTTAVAAYRRFLELAPDDSRAPLVKQEIERLEAASAVAPSVVSPSG